MKKLLSILLVIGMALCLVSCGSSKPKNVGNVVYDYSKLNIEIVDKYLDNEITGGQAYNQCIDAITSELYQMVDAYSFTPEEKEIWIVLSQIRIYFETHALSDENESILMYRNDLAKLINVKER